MNIEIMDSYVTKTILSETTSKANEWECINLSKHLLLSMYVSILQIFDSRLCEIYVASYLLASKKLLTTQHITIPHPSLLVSYY